MIVDAAATPTDLLDAGARLSRRFGEDPEYARAGGGNSSVKDGGTLYIKPSGVSLASDDRRIADAPGDGAAACPRGVRAARPMPAATP